MLPFEVTAIPTLFLALSFQNAQERQGGMHPMNRCVLTDNTRSQEVNHYIFTHYGKFVYTRKINSFKSIGAL